MPVSPQKRISNDRYNQKCDSIQIRPIKSDGAAIRAAAAAAGQSVQGWLLQAARERMARDGFTAAPPAAEDDPAPEDAG